MNKKWKALIVLNLVLSLALVVLCVQLYVSKNQIRSDFFLEIAKQDILIKDQQNAISDLQMKVDDLIWRMNRNEVSKFDHEPEYSLDRKEAQVNVHYNDSNEEPGTVRQRSYGFSYDTGECTGVGDGIVGLFVDVYTKCPGNVFGYSIKVD
ncbi:MAG: hypothetical protein CMK89_16440 [Pseudomonadales bacterium]|nr:hypothetical protein [Pseudomonadales bacterium]